MYVQPLVGQVIPETFDLIILGQGSLRYAILCPGSIDFFF